MINLWTRDLNGDRDIRDVAEISDIPVMQSNIFCVASAEDNGTLATNRMDFSFGNGNEQADNNGRAWGLVIPFDGLEIVALTFGSRVSVDGNGASVELVKNPNANADGRFQGTGLIVDCPANTYYGVAQGSVVFNAGETLQFITRNPGGQDVVVSAWGRWT